MHQPRVAEGEPRAPVTPEEPEARPAREESARREALVVEAPQGDEATARPEQGRRAGAEAPAKGERRAREEAPGAAVDRSPTAASTPAPSKTLGPSPTAECSINAVFTSARLTPR